MFSMILRNCAVIVAVVISASPVSSHFNAQDSGAMTFEKVVEYLRLDINETRLLKLIDDSPTRFVLGDDQIQALRTAGATNRLIQAMLRTSQGGPEDSDISDFILVLDCSGSMNDRLPGGGTKWQAAQRAAIELMRSIPDGRRLAVIAYGSDPERRGESVEVVRPLLPIDPAAKRTVAESIESFKAVGHAPIATSLEAAGRELEGATGLSSIIVITDGMDTCQSDPVAESSRLAARFPSLRGVNVVGLCLGEVESQKLSEVARAGCGQFYAAKDLAQLMESVHTIERTMTKADLIGSVNLGALSDADRLLIEQLGDADPQVRSNAATLVGERKVLVAAPALIEMMIDDQFDALWGTIERQAALEALAIIAPEKIAPTLVAMAQSSNSRVRCWAATTAADRGIKQAAPSLEQQLLSEDLDISANENEHALQGLIKLDRNRAENVLVRLLKSPDACLRTWAMQMLETLN